VRTIAPHVIGAHRHQFVELIVSHDRVPNRSRKRPAMGHPGHARVQGRRFPPPRGATMFTRSLRARSLVTCWTNNRRHLSLCSQPRDRDLDNLADPLLHFFNRRFRSLTEVQLSKTRSPARADELLSVFLYCADTTNAA